MLYSSIRVLRASTAALLIPNDPVQAIATTEMAGLVISCFDRDIILKTIAISMSIAYAPSCASVYVDKLFEIKRMQQQGEVCCLLLLFATMVLNHNFYVS